MAPRRVEVTSIKGRKPQPQARLLVAERGRAGPRGDCRNSITFELAHNPAREIEGGELATELLGPIMFADPADELLGDPPSLALGDLCEQQRLAIAGERRLLGIEANQRRAGLEPRSVTQDLALRRLLEPCKVIGIATLEPAGVNDRSPDTLRPRMAIGDLLDELERAIPVALVDRVVGEAHQRGHVVDASELFVERLPAIRPIAAQRSLGSGVRRKLTDLARRQPRERSVELLAGAAVFDQAVDASDQGVELGGWIRGRSRRLGGPAGEGREDEREPEQPSHARASNAMRVGRVW